MSGKEIFGRGFLEKAYGPKEKGDSSRKNQEVPKKTQVFDTAKNAANKGKHKVNEVKLPQDQTQQIDGIPSSSSLFKSGFLNTKPKEAETKSSRSEAAPKTNLRLERQISNEERRDKAAHMKFQQQIALDKYITDKYRPIPIIDENLEPLSLLEQKTQEAELVQEMGKENGKKISDYDPSYNCYSYVFTDGKAGRMDPYAVDMIIEQNGFKKIASASHSDSDYICPKLPKEGDIVIYRSKDNIMVHAGITIKNDINPKNIIVRSKMGEMGIFEHPITLSYLHRNRNLSATHWEIYHTDRPQGRLITETPSDYRNFLLRKMKEIADKSPNN